MITKHELHSWLSLYIAGATDDSRSDAYAIATDIMEKLEAEGIIPPEGQGDDPASFDSFRAMVVDFGGGRVDLRVTPETLEYPDRRALVEVRVLCNDSSAHRCIYTERREDG